MAAAGRAPLTTASTAATREPTSVAGGCSPHRRGARARGRSRCRSIAPPLIEGGREGGPRRGVAPSTSSPTSGCSPMSSFARSAAFRRSPCATRASRNGTPPGRAGSRSSSPRPPRARPAWPFPSLLRSARSSSWRSPQSARVEPLLRPSRPIRRRRPPGCDRRQRARAEELRAAPDRDLRERLVVDAAGSRAARRGVRELVIVRARRRRASGFVGTSARAGPPRSMRRLSLLALRRRTCEATPALH